MNIDQQAFGIAIVIFNFILLILLFLLYLQFLKLKKHYSQLIGKTDHKDLLKTFTHLVTIQNRLAKKIDQQKLTIEQLKNQMKKHIQHLSFKRFNPFADTGGNQSFTMSLLSDNRDGIVLTALHSRDTTRIYAKRIKQGQADEKLSKEEQFVVAKHESTGDNS